MKTLYSLLKRIERLERKASPINLDALNVYLTDGGQDWPGCKDTNKEAYRLAARRVIGVEVYQGIGPDDIEAYAHETRELAPAH